MRALTKKIYAQHALLIRFLMVGGVNTAVGIFCFPALYFFISTLRTHYLFLMVICQIICISFSYTTNKYFVFRTTGISFWEYLRFTFFYNIIFLINLIILPILVSYWKMNPAKIQLVINIFIAIGSYFWHNHITFSQSNRKDKL